MTESTLNRREWYQEQALISSGKLIVVDRRKHQVLGQLADLEFQL
jgi:hypothetical protein